MRPTDFDEFTKALGAARSRREMLKILGGAVTVGAFGAPTVSSPRHVGLRPALRRASQQSCSATNKVSTRCTSLNDYAMKCGVICPDGTRLLGKGGCTIPNAQGKLPDWHGHVTYNKRVGRGWCASTMVSGTFTADPKSTTLDWTPSQPACCSDVCDAEVKAVLNMLAQHERRHREIIVNAVAASTSAWTNRTFSACGGSKTAAGKALDNKITNAYNAEVAKLEKEFKQEPPQPRPIDCSKCIPKSSSNECCNGACVKAGQCQQQIWCQCNRTCYTSLAACTSECHATLGCFTNICAPVTTCPP